MSRKKPGLIALVLCVSFLMTPISGSATPEKEVPGFEIQGRKEFIPGEVAVFYLQAPEEIQDALVELQSPRGQRILVFASFPLPGEKEEWVALGGLPSTLALGDYRLSAQIQMKNKKTEGVATSIQILSRDFVYEDISLNQAMSELRSESDWQKTEEARELYRLLGKVDPAAIFHTEKFYHPVGDFPKTSFYGDRRTFIYSDGGRAKAIHYGIDYATPRGTPVRSCGAGRVVMARERIITGHTVVLEHLPGVYSLYYHLDQILVEEGAMVGAGEDIGLSGATGLVTGPHLHWEVRVAGNAVEPTHLLSEGILDKNALFGMME